MTEDFQSRNDQSKKEHKKRKAEMRRKEGNETPAFIRFFSDRRTHIILGIILILFAFFTLVTTINYFKTGERDQSQIINNEISQIVQNGNDIDNVGGAFGAYLSDLMMSEWLGLGAFILVLYLGIIGYSLIRKRKCGFWSLTFKSLILAITISIVIGLVTFNNEGFLYWGGKHGHFINLFLISHTGILGAICVSFILIATTISIYINDIRNIYLKSREQINLHRQRQTRIDAEREEKENRIKNIKDPIIDEIPEETNINANSTTISEVAFNELSETKGQATNINSTDTELEIKVATIEEATEIRNDVYDPTAELSKYRFPSIELLHERQIKKNSVDRQEQEENKERITKTLNDYGIAISHIEATVGPTVTLYEIIPAEGVRIAKIKRLEDDIALSLAALGIRIIAPIPGKGTIGIEVPNKDPQTVSIRSIISSKKFQDCKYALPMAMGSTISNDVFIADLTKMPHLLVAGATGQGKSVGLNAIITSLLHKKHPAELKFVLIDPKMVEFSLYSKLERHYLAKLPDEDDAIITDPAKVVTTLNSLCIEMDNRYALLKEAGVRSLSEYNAKFVARRLNPEKGHRYLPYIVMIVDEFADLIMTAGKEVETPIARIAQKARAVGMHMIIATQRPSTNVITGTIKANFPGRIAFRVSQMVDSKTILDRTGANQLIGRGDMLFSHNGEMQRVQCAFIDTDEVESICDCVDEQIGYDHAYYLPEYIPEANENGSVGTITDRDPLFEEAARFIINSQTASTSSLQRRYSIGYNRAGKIMDQMEAAGIVGPSQGGKPRQVLMDSLQLERVLEMM